MRKDEKIGIMGLGQINSCTTREEVEKIGIMGLGQINSCTTREEVEKISVKPKPIEKIIKEEEVFKITGLHRFDDLDYKTLLRYERGVIPPNFYNKRKKK